MEAVKMIMPSNYDRLNQFFKSFDNFGFYKFNAEMLKKDEDFCKMAKVYGEDIFDDDVHGLVYGYGKENELLLYLTKRGIITLQSPNFEDDESAKENMGGLTLRVKEFIKIKYGYDVDQIIKDHGMSESK